MMESLLLIVEGDKDYYNVVVKGQKYYLKRNKYYFSLDIYNNDMTLKEKTLNEPYEPIVLGVYDGTAIKAIIKNKVKIK